ncbi:MAG: type II secretion system minor pseudopilin GspH [Saccharospirillum sp.]
MTPWSSNHQAGFTLMELLVVLIIIGVAAGAVRLAVTDEAPMAEVEQDAERLAYRFGQVQDRVLLSNRERGVLILQDELVFLDWREGDPMAGEPDILWSETDSNPSRWRAGEQTELALQLDGRWLELSPDPPENERDWQPHLIIMPSEDYHPAFRLSLRHRDLLRGEVWVEGDGFNRLQVVRDAQE